VHVSGNELISGIKTFTSAPISVTPVADQEVATKKYVDDELTAFSAAAGSITVLNDLTDVDLVTNPPVMGQTVIWDGSAFIPGNFVRPEGNELIAGIKTFTSAPISVAPVADQEVATKKYVDDNAGLTSVAKADITDFNESDYVRTIGDDIIGGNKDFTGMITAVSPVADQQLATKKYVDDNAGLTSVAKSDITDFTEADYVHASGNELISGIKTFTSVAVGVDPVNPQELATKAYVDTYATSFIPMSFAGVLPDATQTAQFVIPGAYTINTAGHPNVVCVIAPSGGPASFTIKRNGTQIGTVEILDGATQGTVTISTTVTLVANDILTIDTVVQNGASDVSFTLSIARTL
jgi:hypothetical protein